MGTYIKGFKPKDGLYVIKDGVIRKYKGNGGTVRPYELVEVKEPHGRLIDADEIVKDLRHDVAVDQDMLDYEELTDVIRETTQADKDIKQNAAEIIESLPTVQFEERTEERTETHACDLIKRQDVKHAPTIETEQQWIPCSERLPQESDLVIICSEFGGIEFGSYEEGKWYWLAESCSYYLEESIDEVVAWMPMPEKYREDNK